MEYRPDTYDRFHTDLFHEEFHAGSESSLSSSSETLFNPLGLISKKPRKRKVSQQSHQRRDYITRIFERRKLKEKSLSKKMKTPFDRKLYRTCWPIELKKVTKIKKKPKEKRKGKPNNRSLKKKKFSNPTLTSRSQNVKKKKSAVSGSETEFIDEKSLDEFLRNLNTNHFLYEPVTPQMLIDVLRDPEHLRSGATLDMIIAKLRALKLGLNPTLELLKEEVLQKLECAIKLGLVTESNGFYTLVDRVRMHKLPRKKVDAFWELYRRVAKHYNDLES